MKEACKRMNISRMTLWRMVQAGTLTIVEDKWRRFLKISEVERFQ